MIEVKVKKLHKDAKIPFKKFDRDFCYDVVATSCVEVAPQVYRYGIGLAFEIADDGYDEDLDEGLRLSVDFRPRSSVWKTGMVLSNCEGTIDQLYRGEVSAVFYHVLPNMPKYEVGDRIGQVKIGVTEAIEWQEVAELSDTERGDGGYGSTGK